MYIATRSYHPGQFINHGALQMMREMRILRIREFILAGAFLISLWGSFPALANQPDEHDWQRIEKQVDKLTENAGSNAVSIEKRLTAMEWSQKQIDEKLEVLTKLGLGIMASVAGLIVQALWGLIVGRKAGIGQEATK